MFTRMLFTGTYVGIAVGLLASIAYALFISPLILTAERYEMGLVELPGYSLSDSGQSQASHIEGEPSQYEHALQQNSAALDIQRILSTSLFSVITMVGFGLFLTAIMGYFERELSFSRGLLWGLAGFLTFFLAPALGTPPSLPGYDTILLEDRQIWWTIAVLFTGAGLLMSYVVTNLFVRVGCLALLMFPHLLGAPQSDVIIPMDAELLTSFLFRTTTLHLCMWLVLGGLCGVALSKLEGLPILRKQDTA